MTRNQQIGKFLKALAIIGIPLGALMIVSSASGKKKEDEKISPPEPKSDDLVPPELKRAMDNWLGNSGAGGGADGQPQPLQHVAWFVSATAAAQGFWIGVQVYPDTAEITEDTNLLVGPLAVEITYRARFRWAVMMTADVPIAVGDTTGEGVETSLAGDRAEAIDAARREAAQAAADDAGEWIEAWIKAKAEASA